MEKSKVLKGLRIAVMIADGFEASEFEVPYETLRNAGAQVDVLVMDTDQLQSGVQGMKHLMQEIRVRGDRLLRDADPKTYQGLLIPGGALSVDQMRESPQHLAFIQNFMDAEKPVAAICHAGWLLADAGVLRGRTMTSWPSIRKDLERAGAIWKDQEVIVDRNLITSRKPADLQAFCRELTSLLIQSFGSHSQVA